MVVALVPALPYAYIDYAVHDRRGREDRPLGLEAPEHSRRPFRSGAGVFASSRRPAPKHRDVNASDAPGSNLARVFLSVARDECGGEQYDGPERDSSLNEFARHGVRGDTA